MRTRQMSPGRFCLVTDTRFENGGIAQLGERGLCKPEARGSSPLTSTKTIRGLHGPFSFARYPVTLQ